MEDYPGFSLLNFPLACLCISFWQDRFPFQYLQFPRHSHTFTRPSVPEMVYQKTYPDNNDEKKYHDSNGKMTFPPVPEL